MTQEYSEYLIRQKYLCDNKCGADKSMCATCNAHITDDKAIIDALIIFAYNCLPVMHQCQECLKEQNNE